MDLTGYPSRTGSDALPKGTTRCQFPQGLRAVRVADGY